jgi:PAS domain S-box-containing protein
MNDPDSDDTIATLLPPALLDPNRRNDLYRGMFAGVDSGFCVVEVDLNSPLPDDAVCTDYRVVEANAAFYRETGFPEAIFGQWLREAAPALEDHWFEMYGSVVRTRTPVRFEQGSDLLGRWFSVFAFPVGEPADNLVAILFNDVSDRRAAQAELNELNRELERRVAERTAERDRLWQRSLDLFGIADSNGIWLSVNPAWTTILGWEASEIVGQTSEWIEHPDDKAKTREEVSRLASGVETVAFENRFRAKNGTYRDLSWTAVPENGLLYTVARDVTAERANKVALSLAQDALRQAQKMEAVGQLTGGIAHDFNNMLAVVIGGLNLAQRKLSKGDTDIVRFIEGAVEGAQRAAELTNRLLAFSRQQPLAPKGINLNRLVNDMGELLTRTLGETIEVETVLGAGLWQVEADPAQLESAPLNLAVNARDAMHGRGRLTIETSNAHIDRRNAQEYALPEGHYVLIGVTDTGTGMTSDVIEKAFDPFYTTKGVGKGTGLGLSQVYGFVRQSGGHVKIYSEVGVGTTMKIYLPRSLATLSEDVAPPAETVHGGATAEVVMVVEDEDRVRTMAVETLRELGYSVIAMGSPRDALAAIRAGSIPDLLFTDVVMPEMSGRELVEQVKALQPDLKILYTTGYARNAIVHNGTLDRGTELLSKPYTIEELAGKVRAILDR